jgi:hypothetical protein
MALSREQLQEIISHYPTFTIPEWTPFANSFSNRGGREKCFDFDIEAKANFELVPGGRRGTVCTTSCYTIPHANPYDDPPFGVSVVSSFYGTNYLEIPRVVIYRNCKPLVFINIGQEHFDQRQQFAKYFAKVLLGDDYNFDLPVLHPRIPNDMTVHERMIWYFLEQARADYGLLHGLAQLDTPYEAHFGRHVFSTEYQIFSPERDCQINCVYFEGRVYYDVGTWKAVLQAKLRERQNYLLKQIKSGELSRLCLGRDQEYPYSKFKENADRLMKVCTNLSHYALSGFHARSQEVPAVLSLV